MKHISLVVVTCSALFTVSVAAAPGCIRLSPQIVSNNSWILLGGNARGAVRQIVAGEFGKDVDSQQRMLVQFDACGGLQRADISLDKQEHNTSLSTVQHIARVADGWLANYTSEVRVHHQDRQQVIDSRQGTIHWQIDRHGSIVSSVNTFSAMDRSDTLTTWYHFDRQGRLAQSQSQENTLDWHWDEQGRLIAAVSQASEDRYIYDSTQREWQLITRTRSPVSELHAVETCQLWDETGNCSLSYRDEKEIFPEGVIERHLATAYKYQYWDRPAEK